MSGYLDRMRREKELREKELMKKGPKNGGKAKAVLSPPLSTPPIEHVEPFSTRLYIQLTRLHSYSTFVRSLALIKARKDTTRIQEEIASNEKRLNVFQPDSSKDRERIREEWARDIIMYKKQLVHIQQSNESWQTAFREELFVDANQLMPNIKNQRASSSSSSSSQLAPLSDFLLLTLHLSNLLAPCVNFQETAAQQSCGEADRKRLSHLFCVVMKDTKKLLDEYVVEDGKVKTEPDAQMMIDSASRAYALDLIPPLLTRFPSITISSVSHNQFRFISTLTSHSIDYTSMITFIPHGLDPTFCQRKKDGKSWKPSCIMIARGMQEKLPPAWSLDKLSTDTSLITKLSEHDWIEDESDVFTGKHRREKFLRHCLVEWNLHAAKVKLILLEAAPERLIPPLVNIVAGYLDFD